MSTDYYLNCEAHNEAVHLTDNKLNPPINSDLLKMFLMCHFRHNVFLESEHDVEYENVKRFEDWFKEWDKERQQIEERLGND